MITISNQHTKLFGRGLLDVCVILIFSSMLIENISVYASEIEEVIVTAQKREQKVFDVPMSIAAIGDAELETRGIQSIQDLSFAVPDLSVIESAPGEQKITIRGVGSISGQTSLVGIYLDEMPVSSSLFTQLDLRAYDLERVEVLRGPQGTLYGQGSAGGTVRLITRDPELDRFTGRADVAASFTEGGNPSQAIVGILNIPVIEDNFGLRVTGTYENKGGWIDQPAAAREDINDHDLFDIRAKGLWQPFNDLAVKGTVIVHQNDIGAKNEADGDGNYTPAVFPTADTPMTDDYELYNLTVTYDFGSITLLSSSGYSNIDKLFTSSFAFLGVVEVLVDDAYDVEVFNQEVRLSSAGDGALAWTAGFYYQDQSLFIESNADLAVAGFILPPIHLPVIRESKSWALFGDASFNLTDRLEVGAGLRYFEDDREFNDGTGLQSDTFDTLNPRAYLSYEFIDGVKAYANVAKGFRSGGFNPAGLPPFQPEDLISYEVGTKLSLFRGRLDAGLAFFYSEYNDMLVFGPLSPTNPVSITSNAGEAEIKGIDWDITWRPLDRLTLQFSGNVIDTEIKDSGTSVSLVAGDPVDGVPDYGYSLSLDYRFQWSKNIPGFLRLDYNELGKQTVTSREYGLIGKSDILNLLNVRVGVQWKYYSVELFGQNLLDDNGAIDGWLVRSSRARPWPRTIGVKLGVDFN